MRRVDQELILGPGLMLNLGDLCALFTDASRNENIAGSSISLE